jgi:hypothetical protein
MLRKQRKRAKKERHLSHLSISLILALITVAVYVVSLHTLHFYFPRRIYLGLARGWIEGRTGLCGLRTAPTVGQSADASQPELDDEPNTVLLQDALQQCQLCGGDGGEAPGGSHASILPQG